MTRRIPPVRRLLIKAKALIFEEENWCKEAYARSAKGQNLSLYSSRASRFCATGASLAAGGVSMVAINHAIRLLGDQTEDGLIDYNDAPITTHPMIMRLFNQAIKRAKEQGI